MTFPDESGFSFPPPICSGKEPAGISGLGFLQAGCPSRHPTNSVKALEETQNNDPTSGLVSPFLHPPWEERCSSILAISAMLPTRAPNKNADFSHHYQQPPSTLSYSVHDQIMTNP